MINWKKKHYYNYGNLQSNAWNTSSTSSWCQSCNTSPHIKKSGNFCFQNPESRKFLLVESWIQEIFASRILNPGKFCLWNPEPWTLKCRKQLKESRIPVTIGIRDPSFTDKESGIQYLESGIHGDESVIQDCLGFPYIRWNTNKTSFIYVIMLTSRRIHAQLVSGLIYPIE